MSNERRFMIREGSLADLEEKAKKYDSIIKIVPFFDNFEQMLIIYCNYDKTDDVIDFCKNNVPFGVDFEIREVVL